MTEVGSLRGAGHERGCQGGSTCSLEVVVLGLAMLAGHRWGPRLLEGAAGCEGRACLAQAGVEVLAWGAPGLPSRYPHGPLLPRPTLLPSASSSPPPLLPPTKLCSLPHPLPPARPSFHCLTPHARPPTLPTPPSGPHTQTPYGSTTH